jgi:multisubunit Na+/H+ antiporter MnhB subunit
MTCVAFAAGVVVGAVLTLALVAHGFERMRRRS